MNMKCPIPNHANEKGIQVNFFTLDQIFGKSLQCIFANFELSTSSRFQDIAVQNQQLFSYFSVAIS